MCEAARALFVRHENRNVPVRETGEFQVIDDTAGLNLISHQAKYGFTHNISPFWLLFSFLGLALHFELVIHLADALHPFGGTQDLFLFLFSFYRPAESGFAIGS